MVGWGGGFSKISVTRKMSFGELRGVLSFRPFTNPSLPFCDRDLFGGTERWQFEMVNWPDFFSPEMGHGTQSNQLQNFWTGELKLQHFFLIFVGRA